MTLEETVISLQRERDELARRTREAEEIRAAMCETARQVGVDMLRALGEIQELQKVADAAVKWRNSADLSAIGEHLSAARDLRVAVDVHLERVRKRS